ncbi:hypothetical protein ANOM_011551 [Aspergillus nomiae NRRL 13137]|uniref:Uncharacterized protein n=1 Tax=Aspergillus nomiae NRRL (strain ATCC 15546 / NRRL 13137 / CBS 260.88 / M93) TaxID=1509407 RepID=A0A0L1IMT4_ASPN3|nr:uncharacterized protein ANOM_011551 [Aspergillus nomiae NRRL 13137]KNG80600.1 hypothetical protein ANOM_011551 [Aspergillus nomiae NRRL 13137]
MEHQQHLSSDGTRVHTARKRRHSDTSAKLTDIKHVHTLQKTVLNVLLDRLAEGGVNTDSITPELVNHCLPTSLDNSSWETLLYTPLKLSDCKLQDMLRLKAPRELDDQNLQQTTIYVRCFQIKVDQLQEVIAQFHGTGIQYAKITMWLGGIMGMQSDETVYIRYVGRTTRTQGAIKRHREDLLTRRTGFFSKFLTCLERTFPTVIDSASIYVFPYKKSGGFREIQQFNDIAEQAAIVLLGLPYLLNQVLTKTEDWSLKLQESHWQQFDALNTRTISRLNPCEFYPIAKEPLIASWADDIQCYAKDHQGSVSFFRQRSHSFPDVLRDMIFRQAMPSAWNGRFVLLLTVGAGNSREGYKEQQPFYTGPSQSANLLRISLNRLWNREESNRPERDYLRDLVAAGVFPFVDLCPWYKAEGEDLLAAARLLKQYVMTVKPLIMLTFSAKPSAIIASGFSLISIHRWPSKFWDRVGQLELVSCGEFYGIQIPCFHPGQGRFSLDPSVFLIVLDMTLWVLLTTMTVFLDSVEQYEGRSRKEWCEHVKQKVDDTLQDKRFYEQFSRLKAKLHAERPNASPTQLSTHTRPRIAVAIRKELDRDIVSGFAVGERLSDKRRQQVYRLWKINIPELHVHIGRENANEWFLWANSISEGKSLYVDALTQAVWNSQSDAVQHRSTPTAMKLDHSADNSDKFHKTEKPSALLKEFSEVLAANKLKSNYWVSSDSIERAVTTQLMKDTRFWEWIHSTRISSKLPNGSFIRFRSTYRSRWNGREVFVWKNSSFGIYWECPSGQNFRFIMRAPQSSQDSSYTPRKYIFLYVVSMARLSFTVPIDLKASTKDGIDLRDETGKSCLVHRGALNSDDVVTFPARHLPNCQETAELGRQLVRLWEAETDLDWKATAAASDSLQNQVEDEGGSHIPKGFFAGKGLQLVRLNWSSEKLQPYRKPPQPADETWLLWLCLQESWPLGGIVFIGIPEKWPSRKDNIWTHLQE